MVDKLWSLVKYPAIIMCLRFKSSCKNNKQRESKGCTVYHMIGTKDCRRNTVVLICLSTAHRCQRRRTSDGRTLKSCPEKCIDALKHA